MEDKRFQNEYKILLGLKQENTAKDTFHCESVAVISQDTSRINILIYSEISGRWPEVIINMYTLEVALAEKGSSFSNKTPEELTYKQESFSLSCSKHSVFCKAAKC